MGVEHHKRPLRVPGVIVTGSAGSTFTASDAAGGIGLEGPLRIKVESVTLSTAAQTLSAHGVSFVTYGSSGKPSDVILPTPPFSGAVKEIFVVNNTTSVEANINTNATANTFWGTTFNTIAISAASTGSPGGTPAGAPYLRLIGASTTQWAVTVGSTFNWDFSASTGSTATP